MSVAMPVPLALESLGPIESLIAKGALFVVNHSGGKDSQAMLIRLLERIPADQILVVHATLGDVEWEGALDLAEKQACHAGVPFVVARAGKSFLDMVERRFAVRPDVPSWPSADHRQCTSDLKRGPIEREVRRYVKAHGISTIVNCVGIRAQESSNRAKQEVFRRNGRNSVAGREWYDWLPIHTMKRDEVFATIRAAGQEPHWAYAAGNDRLSCVFCIMGSRRDLANGAKHRPELFAKYIELEQRTGYTMHMTRIPLQELAA
jgi:3'-phosphoadenosine 5'-phosphosulfate sulfotransferase (PAPS reductase)/FAD synthetase